MVNLLGDCKSLGSVEEATDMTLKRGDIAPALLLEKRGHADSLRSR